MLPTARAASGSREGAPATRRCSSLKGAFFDILNVLTCRETKQRGARVALNNEEWFEVARVLVGAGLVRKVRRRLACSAAAAHRSAAVQPPLHSASPSPLPACLLVVNEVKVPGGADLRHQVSVGRNADQRVEVRLRLLLLALLFVLLLSLQSR